MPTSPYNPLIFLVEILRVTMPSSILDVGLGNGKQGFIARDCLDVMLGERYRRSDWRVRIDGIEVFADYIQDHQRAIYDTIYIGDAYTVLDTLGFYDLVILGDVLEHFERDQAFHFLDKCAQHGGAILLNIPLGEKWQQEEIYGNPYEVHRSFWKPEDFESFAAVKQITVDRDYGCFYIKRDDYISRKKA